MVARLCGVDDGGGAGLNKNPMEKACLQFAWWPTKLPLNRRGEALLLLSWRKMRGIIWKIFCMMAVAGRCPPASSSGPYSSPAVVHMRGGWDLRVSRLKDTGQLPLHPHCTVFVLVFRLYWCFNLNCICVRIWIVFVFVFELYLYADCSSRLPLHCNVYNIGTLHCVCIVYVQVFEFKYIL